MSKELGVSSVRICVSQGRTEGDRWSKGLTDIGVGEETRRP